MLKASYGSLIKVQSTPDSGRYFSAQNHVSRQGRAAREGSGTRDCPSLATAQNEKEDDERRIPETYNLYYAGAVQRKPIEKLRTVRKQFWTGYMPTSLTAVQLKREENYFCKINM